VTKLTNNTEQQEEAPIKLTEHKKTEFLAFPLKTIISPFKAFKDIVQNPDFRGLILVVGLIIITTTGAYYAYASKFTWTVDSQLASLLASNMLASYILSVVTQTALLFFFNWLIYAGVLLLVMRAFGEKGGSWRPFFVLVGYAFSTMIVQWAVSALLIATLPEIHFTNLNTWPPSTQNEIAMANDTIQKIWGPIPAYQALAYLSFPFDIWLVILSVIAVRAFSETVWRKAVMISISAFLIRFFLRFFLGF